MALFAYCDSLQVYCSGTRCKAVSFFLFSLRLWPKNLLYTSCYTSYVLIVRALSRLCTPVWYTRQGFSTSVPCMYVVETLVSIKFGEIAYKGYLDKFKFGSLNAM